MFLCRCCVTACVPVSPILSSLSGPHSLRRSLFLPVCVCACARVRVCVRSNAPCAPESDFLRVGLAPLSLFLPPCLGPEEARQRFSPPFHFGSLRASTT